MSDRCIAGWPQNPCGVLTITPPICGYHRAVAEAATAHLSDEEIEETFPQIPLFADTANGAIQGNTQVDKFNSDAS
jgi:hypothetical protein